jgi:hypothetical protein
MPDDANVAPFPFPFRSSMEREREQRKRPPLARGECEGRERRRSSSGRVTPDFDAGGKRRKSYVDGDG